MERGGRERKFEKEVGTLNGKISSSSRVKESFIFPPPERLNQFSVFTWLERDAKVISTWPTSVPNEEDCSKTPSFWKEKMRRHSVSMDKNGKKAKKLQGRDLRKNRNWYFLNTFSQVINQKLLFPSRRLKKNLELLKKFLGFKWNEIPKFLHRQWTWVLATGVPEEFFPRKTTA